MRKYDNEKEVEVIIDNYTNKKWGLLKSGAQFGMSKSKTKRILTDNGVKIRTNSEAQRKYSLNEKYFDVESHNMAYILGLFAADGTIRKDSNEIKITLSSIDKEILEKIQLEIGSSRPLREFTTEKGYQNTTLDFCSERMKLKLAEYGVVPNKTTNLIPPIKLNPLFIPDYIRGYFDGDGCITTTGYLNHGIEWKIVSASKEILDYFENYFFEQFGVPKIHIHWRKKEKNKLQLYDLRYSTNFSKQLYDILYTPNALFLQRKKERYEQLIMK